MNPLKFFIKLVGVYINFPGKNILRFYQILKRVCEPLLLTNTKIHRNQISRQLWRRNMPGILTKWSLWKKKKPANKINETLHKLPECCVLVRLQHCKGKTKNLESVQIKGTTKTKDLEIISSVKWLIKLEMSYREKRKPWRLVCRRQNLGILNMTMSWST